MPDKAENPYRAATTSTRKSIKLCQACDCLQQIHDRTGRHLPAPKKQVDRQFDTPVTSGLRATLSTPPAWAYFGRTKSAHNLKALQTDCRVLDNFNRRQLWRNYVGLSDSTAIFKELLAHGVFKGYKNKDAMEESVEKFLQEEWEIPRDIKKFGVTNNDFKRLSSSSH